MKKKKRKHKLRRLKRREASYGQDEKTKANQEQAKT